MKNCIILGSGRSGTSMVAGMIAKEEYFMGTDYLGKRLANKKGFFEGREINEVNEHILDPLFTNWPEPIRSLFFPAYPFPAARWLAEIKETKEIQLGQNTEKVVAELVTKQPFCYKDPRFSYTLKAWLPLLPNETKFIVVFRNPASTAKSINREVQELEALQKLKFSEKKALKVWKAMYESVLKEYYLSNSPQDWFFMHYYQAFEPPKLNSLELLLESELDRDFPDKSLNRSEKEPLVPQKDIRELYAKLCDLAEFPLTHENA